MKEMSMCVCSASPSPLCLSQFFLPTQASTCVDADVHAPGYLGLCTQGGWRMVEVGVYVYTGAYVCAPVEGGGRLLCRILHSTPVFCLTSSSSAAPALLHFCTPVHCTALHCSTLHCSSLKRRRAGSWKAPLASLPEGDEPRG